MMGRDLTKRKRERNETKMSKLTEEEKKKKKKKEEEEDLIISDNFL
jgi:hypothetical protein